MRAWVLAVGGDFAAMVVSVLLKGVQNMRPDTRGGNEALRCRVRTEIKRAIDYGEDLRNQPFF